MGIHTIYVRSLVPRSRFLSLSVQKCGVSFLTWEWHNRKMAKICRTNSCISTNYKLNCLQQSAPNSKIHEVSYLVSWLFLLFWALCTHTQLNSFYHPFYPDVTHVRKDTRLSPAFPYWSGSKTNIRILLLSVWGSGSETNSGTLLLRVWGSGSKTIQLYANNAQ